MDKGVHKIIIRVYGLIINEKQEVLISDEYALGSYMIKFPGGGLEPGEGTIDCLKREAVEEFGQKIEIIEHFYTTDFYQKALFYEDTQLISIYYTVKFSAEIQFKISTKKFDFDINKNQNQSFRWVLISDLDINEISYPIDKKVAWMLKGKYS